MIPGPCCICGAIDYELSMGGPSICPRCDCGDFGINAIKRQRDIILELRREIDALRLRASDDRRIV